jgi:hypothetical protein
MANACNLNQISNRNFLSPVGFKFTIANYPKVGFFSNSARIPEINLALAMQPSYLKDIDVHGEKLTYGDLNIRFIVDEGLENYMIIHNWLTGLGFPETTQDYIDLITTDSGRDPKSAFSDASLHILNSNFKDSAVVKFKDVFPYSLSSLEFDSTATDVQYFTAEASFKYTVYNILGTDNKPL